MKIVKAGAWLLLSVQLDATALDYATNNDPALAALIAESLDRNPQVREAVVGAPGGAGARPAGRRAAGSDVVRDPPPA